MIGYILIFMVGILLGALGSGGSIFLIPILIFLFHFTQADAIAIAYIITGFSSFIGSIEYYPQVKWQKEHLFFIVPAITSTWLSHHYIIPSIPPVIHGIPFEQILIITLGILMIFAAGAMWQKPRPNHLEHNEFPTILVAIFYGLLVGLLGTGGGFLLVPTFIVLMHMPFNQAVGASLALIFLTSISGILADKLILESLPSDFLIMAVGMALLGLYVGQKMHHYVPEHILKTVFIIIVLLTAAFLLFHELSAIKMIEHVLF
jgi:uncharacterized membrane protein YfcA